MKTNNSSGKALTIFLIIMAVLLISLTVLSLYFFNLEIDRRKQLEVTVSSMEADYAKADQEISDLKKQNFLLTDKNKEADTRINRLLDEVNLEKGLRDELKKESITLKDQLQTLTQEKEKIENQTATQIGDLEQKLTELEAKLKVEANRSADLEKKNAEVLAEQQKLISTQATATEAPATTKPKTTTKSGKSKSTGKTNVDQEKTQVPPAETEAVVEKIKIPEGRVLSVDVETEFVVINLGEKQGLENGMFMSIYRGNEYLGDIQITRTQEEMSAADLIPPLSGKTVRKNDQVIVK